jgi:hypothetical protein
VAQTNRYFELLKKGDPVTTVAVHNFSESVRLEDEASNTKDQEAALLAAFKVVECIVRAIPIPSASDLEQKQSEVVARLKESLASGTETDFSVRAVRKARDELERLESTFLGLRIAATAPLLNLNPDWAHGAESFASFRNKRLGHAASIVSHEELIPWLDHRSSTCASALARRIIAAYLDTKSGGARDA